MKNYSDSTQKQIDRFSYENYINRLSNKLENTNTQIIREDIKSSDIGFISLAIVNRYELKELVNEQGVWLIKKANDLYKKYKNKETLVEPVVYSRTLINLINKI